MKGVESWSVNDLVRMVNQHFSTCFKGIDDDGSHVSKSYLENGPTVFQGPLLANSGVILTLEGITMTLIHHPAELNVQTCSSACSESNAGYTGNAPGISGIPFIFGISVLVDQ